MVNGDEQPFYRYISTKRDLLPEIPFPLQAAALFPLVAGGRSMLCCVAEPLLTPFTQIPFMEDQMVDDIR